MDLSPKPVKATKVRATKKNDKQTEETKPKIKRPASAYILFSKDIRPTIVKENPTLKAKDIIKIVADKWKELDGTEKKKYEEMHLIAKKEYDELKKQMDV